MTLLDEAALFLGAAVTVVPIFKRLGLGSVLGYLAAGLAIGPSGFALVSEFEDAMHFGEFGVVLLLFLVGLELEPKRLWAMRRIVFGAGGMQVIVTTALLLGAALSFGRAPKEAAIIGFALSLSSTAIALQLLNERKQLGTSAGKTAFGILLFQDIAAIPALAMLPFLAVQAVAPAVAHDAAHGAVEAAPGGMAGWLRIVVALVGLVLGGRLVLRPLFRWIAKSNSQELFTATALMVVVGIALLMERAGLSMALGTFLAGVLLADTEFRHELEADIEPFKGLLLGLFFMAVGMAVNLGLIVEKPLLVAALVMGLIVVKAGVLFVTGRAFGLDNDASRILAISGAQGGEFAFVLFRIATPLGLLAADVNELLVVVVGVSMAVAPLGFVAGDLVRKLIQKEPEKPAYDESLKDESPVIIAGFGRVGQVVGRVLRAKKIRFTAMDASAEHVDFIKRFGNKTFYGDASRIELLRAAQADKAKIFVLAVDDVEASMRIAETVMRNFPHLKIYARSRNRQHTYRLLEMGVTNIFRETFASSIELTSGVLQALGVPADDANRTLGRFRQYDETLLAQSFQHQKDLNKLTELANKATKDLEELFEKDAQLVGGTGPEPTVTPKP